MTHDLPPRMGAMVDRHQPRSPSPSTATKPYHGSTRATPSPPPFLANGERSPGGALVQIPPPTRGLLTLRAPRNRTPWSSCVQRRALRNPTPAPRPPSFFDGLTASAVRKTTVARSAQVRRRWPITDLLSRPSSAAGFYYKTFMWPAAFWEKIYEPDHPQGICGPRLHLSMQEDPDQYDKGFRPLRSPDHWRGPFWPHAAALAQLPARAKHASSSPTKTFDLGRAPQQPNPMRSIDSVCQGAIGSRKHASNCPQWTTSASYPAPPFGAHSITAYTAHWNVKPITCPTQATNPAKCYGASTPNAR